MFEPIGRTGWYFYNFFDSATFFSFRNIYLDIQNHKFLMIFFTNNNAISRSSVESDK